MVLGPLVGVRYLLYRDLKHGPLTPSYKAWPRKDAVCRILFPVDGGHADGNVCVA